MILKRAKGRYLYKFAEGGGILSTAANFLGDFVDSATRIDPNNPSAVQSEAGAIGSGALKGAGQGAELGTAVLPGIGTAVGAVGGAIIGGISGLTGNQAERRAATAARAAREKGFLARSAATLANYDKYGSNNNQIYARFGGKAPIKYFSGGELKPLSDDSVEVIGNSHEQGGVKIAPQVEVEGKETIKGDFVYSDALPADDKGRTFAVVHKALAKTKGRLEERPNTTGRNNAMKLIESKEQMLQVKQEQLKKMLGLTPIPA